MQTFVFFIGELKCQKKVWCSINCIVGYLKEALRNVALFPSHCLIRKKMFTSHRLHVITYISFRQSQKEKKKNRVIARICGISVYEDYLCQ